jgi:hypothetical protein
MEPGTPILVLSCDRYADLWKPFFALFWKHWPDCRHPVYLGTNFQTFADPRVTTLAIGEDVDWASSVRRMLDRIGSDRVVLLLEDFFLEERVDSAAVDRLLEVARAREVGCLRLSPHPPPFSVARNPVPEFPDINRIPAGNPYRVSAQAAVWDTVTLRRLLIPGFSAWDFELVGTEMSQDLEEEFWESGVSTVIYDHGVEKGKWKQRGLDVLRRADIEVDLESRAAFTSDEFARHHDALVALREEFFVRDRAVAAFRAGRRLRGLREAGPLLAAHPLRLRNWVLLAFGIAGPWALRWLDRQRVRAKISAARRKHRRGRLGRPLPS